MAKKGHQGWLEVWQRKANEICLEGWHRKGIEVCRSMAKDTLGEHYPVPQAVGCSKIFDSKP
jgi:hypothetical protein